MWRNRMFENVEFSFQLDQLFGRYSIKILTENVLNLILQDLTTTTRKKELFHSIIYNANWHKIYKK